MNDLLEKDLQTASRWGLILGMVTMLLGVLAIGCPLVPGLAVAVLVAVLLLVAGLGTLLFAFKAGSVGRDFFAVLLGGIAVLGGVVMLVRPVVGLATITLILVWFFVFEGVARLLIAFRSPARQGRGWLFLDGGVSLLLGLLIWRDWPLSGRWAVGTLVGIRLILAGWVMMALGGVGRRVTRELFPPSE